MRENQGTAASPTQQRIRMQWDEGGPLGLEWKAEEGRSKLFVDTNLTLAISLIVTNQLSHFQPKVQIYSKMPGDASVFHMRTKLSP